MIIRFCKTILFFLFVSSAAFAQTFEAGLNFGYNFSRLTISENDIADNLFIRQGTPYNGLSFGAQFSISPPQKQSTPGITIVPSALFEASLCRCGGNIELTVLYDNRRSQFVPLKYIFYRGDYSAKFVASIKNAQFMVGPTLSNNFYAGVDNEADNFGFLDVKEQFKDLAIGYELGAAVKLNTVQLSLRYQRILGTYKEETPDIPTEYKNYQVKVMVHYYFLKKANGLNWGSIYWK